MSDDAVEDLARRLSSGGWKFLFHADGRDYALWAYRSILDPRVTLSRKLSRRGKTSTDTFVFADAEVDVEVPDLRGFLVTDAGRSFSSVAELAQALLRHDAALAEERAWRDAGGASL